MQKRCRDRWCYCQFQTSEFYFQTFSLTILPWFETQHVLTCCRWYLMNEMEFYVKFTKCKESATIYV
jgi:hypothetical protein